MFEVKLDKHVIEIGNNDIINSETLFELKYPNNQMFYYEMYLDDDTGYNIHEIGESTNTYICTSSYNLDDCISICAGNLERGQKLFTEVISNEITEYLETKNAIKNNNSHKIIVKNSDGDIIIDEIYNGELSLIIDEITEYLKTLNYA